jgi:hypothetical protein
LFVVVFALRVCFFVVFLTLLPSFLPFSIDLSLILSN